MPPHWMNDPQGLALLEAAKQEYDDTAPRLVLSDWLEEQGEQEAAQTLRRSLRAPEAWVPLPQEVATRWWPVTHFHSGWPGYPAETSDVETFRKMPESGWLAALRLVGVLSLEGPSAVRPLGSWRQAGEFAAIPALANLACLHLWRCFETGNALVTQLTHSPVINKLVSFDLWRNHLDASAAQALAKSPHLGNLASLLLCRNEIGDQGAMALAESTTLTKLRFLFLGVNGISETGARALAQSPRLGHLTSLDLWQNKLGDAGAIALANSPQAANLTFLGLDSNQIGIEGATALVNSPYLKSSLTLSLTKNPLNFSTQNRLTERFPKADVSFCI